MVLLPATGSSFSRWCPAVRFFGVRLSCSELLHPRSQSSRGSLQVAEQGESIKVQLPLTPMELWDRQCLFQRAIRGCEACITVSLLPRLSPASAAFPSQVLTSKTYLAPQTPSLCLPSENATHATLVESSLWLSAASSQPAGLSRRFPLFPLRPGS